MQIPLVALAQVLVALCIKAAGRWMLWAVALWSLVACAPFVVPPGTQHGPARLEAAAYVANDGVVLPLKTWGTAEQPAALVLGLHGFGDYAGAFETVGMQLAARGIRTFAYDQRGFGAAPGRGRWHGVDRMVDDAAGAVHLLAAAYPDTPVYVLGLSMGGAIAMTMAGERPDLPLAGMALVAPAVWGRRSMSLPVKAGLWLTAHTIPWYPLTGQGLRVQASDNIEMLHRMAKDKLILRQFRADLVWGLVNAMDRATLAASRIRQPTLLLYGLRDELVPLGPTRRTLLTMPSAERRVAVYPDGFHMLLRDLRGAEVVADLAAWLRSPSAPLPSGADRSGMQKLLAAKVR
jgi:acylglycerol lipase